MAKANLIPIKLSWKCPFCLQQNDIFADTTNTECGTCHEKFGVVGALSAGFLISDKEVLAYTEEKERQAAAIGEQT
jgi:hypothetical protein